MVAQAIGDHETSADKANNDAEHSCFHGSVVRRNYNIERSWIERRLNIDGPWSAATTTYRETMDRRLNIDGSVVRRNYNIERPWIERRLNITLMGPWSAATTT